MSYKLNDFEVLELIGSGSFGSCYKVRNRHTHEVIVWKVIGYGSLSEEKKQLLVTEVSLLRDLRHPHIVRYFDRIVCKETKQLYILIEYCPGGDLATVIKTCLRNNTHVEERFVWRVLYQLGSALQTCHSWFSSTIILHRDIKPANVFLDDSGNVKLGDFGLARKLDASQPGCVETMVGTPFYMSPEVMKGEMYNSKSDVWSLGCLVYELCALKPPFHAQNIKDLAYKVSRGRFDRIPHYYSDSLHRVLSSLLLVNQEQRPSIFDLVCHPVILSHLPSVSDNVASCKYPRRPVPPPPLPVITKAPPPSPSEREPEKVSKDAFQSEWLSRLQTLRDKEAAIRHRELELEEKEHSLIRREHRLALMERAVRDKMVLAEVYLKRSRECRSGPSGQSRQSRAQDWQDVDESFSADAGDTSVMPTSALLDPSQVSKPLKFISKPENFVSNQDRHVHFNDFTGATASSLPSAKPSFIKVAEAIRGNKAKIDSEPKPRVQQKVLHLPGYTGPAITVDVMEDFPINLDIDVSPAQEKQNQHQQLNSPVKLTVLYDDRDELQKATNRLDALNLESKRQVPHLMSKTLQKNDTFFAQPELSKRTAFINNVLENKPIAASVDSLLDANPVIDFRRKSMFPQEFPFPSEGVLRKNAYGGSTRRRRKSCHRSSTPLSSDWKTSAENFKENLENAKNNALLFYQKEDRMKLDSGFVKRKVSTIERGKENHPNNEAPPVIRKSMATSLLALPSAAAAATSAVATRSKKSHVSFLR
ncbi:hypothetical protein ONE63_010116 [Megalurothrips usitatus]|uniref:non-specific serine/threonine protein kinase n=1 Tax=Megalurothrips usitatus TaxID=439358 RepID=A0AAV7XNR4_9NEOP|nr:hypothetical protein ONE63_010116 [Megalurothrips usitatus]